MNAKDSSKVLPYLRECLNQDIAVGGAFVYYGPLKAMGAIVIKPWAKAKEKGNNEDEKAFSKEEELVRDIKEQQADKDGNCHQVIKVYSKAADEPQEKIEAVRMPGASIRIYAQEQKDDDERKKDRFAVISIKHQ